MPLLRKHVLSPGKFKVSTPTGPVWKEFSLEDLKTYANNTNTMLSSGLKVPAPFGHSKKALPNKDEPKDSPFNNAGYWELFQVEPTEKGEPGLFGYASIPGTDTEPESPYYKAKNTAKEVSVSIKDSFEDGHGQKWDNIFAHVALVNNPVFHGQEEFQDFPENSLTVNMSMAYSDSEPVENELPALRKALLDAFNISLPECKDVKQFVRDLLVAALQKKPAQGSAQTFEISPVYMSLEGNDMKLSIDQAKALVATKAVNPATKLPFALSDFGYSEGSNDAQLSLLQEELQKKDAIIARQQNLLKTLQSASAETIKKNIGQRIQQLVAKGVITKTHAEAQLIPKLDFQMSLDESGTVANHPLEFTLSALEAMVPVKPSQNTQGVPAVNPLLDDQGASMSLDDIFKEIDEATR